MKATEANLLEFLKKTDQFIVPIYQRAYSWRKEQCKQLWDDIFRTGEDDDIPAHFIGSIMYVKKEMYQVSGDNSILVIDGQQRITTIFLLIEALSRVIKNREIIDGFSSEKLRKYYLLNPLEEGDQKYKLILTQTDKESLLSLIKQKEWPKECSIRIKENFEDFFEKCKKSDDNKLEAICKGIQKLAIVDISLDDQKDNPQLIFESMNSTGRGLSQADLIRNYILMRLEPEEQEELYKDYWRKMEEEFGQEAYDTQFDKFMRYYLTIKTESIPKKEKVYEKFKSYSEDLANSKVDKEFKSYSKKTATSKVKDLVKNIHLFAPYYCAMALDKEKDKHLKDAFKDIRELKVDVAYPFLLKLYDDYKKEILSKEELLDILRLIESYVFRRAVCGIRPNSLNKTFVSLGKAIKKDKYLESSQAYLLLLLSHGRFPRDKEFNNNLKIKDLYNFKNTSYLLRRIENHGRKERVSVNECTIEHILPQNEKLSPEWQKDLGEDWKSIHQTKKHTLGNLTLTGYNSEYSDKPFSDKRDMEGGFKYSPLKLNEGLGHLKKWDKNEIDKRADNLAKIAINVWKCPNISDKILSDYSEIFQI